MRTKFTLLTSLFLMSVLPGTDVYAQAPWPTKPVTFVVPYAAGGMGDLVTRIAKAAPDGYTIALCGPGAISIAPFAQPKDVKYRPLEDLDFVGMFNFNPFVVLVRKSLQIASMKELIAYAKANPEKLNYSTSGIGGGMHFSVVLFEHMTGTRMTHVPYKGGAPATMAVLANEVDFTFTNSSDAMPYLDGKQINVVAVSSGKRLSSAPTIPTIGETVPGYDVITWQGICAPKGLPANAMERLNRVTQEMAEDPAIIERYRQLGSEPAKTTPAEFRAYVAKESTMWSKLLNDIGYGKQ